MAKKKELKFSNELAVNDEIKVGDLICKVTKVEDVFHHIPKSRVRLSLTIVGASKNKSSAILFLPQGCPIEIQNTV
jgi:hypothetical protein